MFNAAAIGLAIALAFIGWEHLNATQPSVGQAISALIALFSLSYIFKIIKELNQNER